MTRTGVRVIGAMVTLVALHAAPTFAADTGSTTAVQFSSRQVLAIADGAHSVTVDDLNADGHPDLLAVTVSNNSLAVMLGDGKGSFQAPRYFPVGRSPKSVATGDFNADGRRDVVVAEQHGDSVGVLLGRGDGTFEERVGYESCLGSYEVFAADLNADDREDIAVACLGEGNVIGIFHGKSDGSFGPRQELPAGLAPHSLTAADLDGDGDQDLLVANHGTHTLSVQLSQAAETFVPGQDLVVGYNPHAVRVADLDQDGHPDVVAVNDANYNVSVLWGSAEGRFTREDLPAMSLPKSVAIADLNGDGRADLLITNTTYPQCCTWPGSVVRVYLNAGGRRFGEASDHFVGGNPFSLWVGDLNGDSRADVVTANYRDLPGVMRRFPKLAWLFDAGLGSPQGRYLRIAAFAALGALVAAATWKWQRRLGLLAGALLACGLIAILLWVRSLKDLSHISILFGS